MAKGKKTGGGKDFAFGNPGGPGRPPTPPDILEAKKLTQAEFARITQKFMALSKAEMQVIAKDPSTPALDLMVLSIISKGINQGDDKRLNFFLDRFIGKVKEEINLNINTYSAITKSYSTELDAEQKRIETDSGDQSEKT